MERVLFYESNNDQINAYDDDYAHGDVHANLLHHDDGLHSPLLDSTNLCLDESHQVLQSAQDCSASCD